jgi:TM2 domain-containing membrane protein YozV
MGVEMAKTPNGDGDEPGFDRGGRSERERDRAQEIERRFLDWVYAPESPADIRPPAVARAAGCSISEAEELLESLAARDALAREVDDEGFVFFRLPGRRLPEAPASKALARVESRPKTPEDLELHRQQKQTQATMGLVLNLVFPGIGSIVAGRTGEGIAQLMLFVISLPLCFLLIGIPLCVAVWGWALSTGIRSMNEAHRKYE